jgi:hypothetical protein
LEVPQEKIFRLQCTIFKNFLTRDVCSARILAKTIGKITSLFHALGTVVYLMTKNAQGWIAEKTSWNGRSNLPETVLIELRFWHKNIGKVRRMPLEKAMTTFTKIMSSNASSTGCGAFIKKCEGTSLVHYWNQTEKKNSSTWHELKAVEIFMREKLSILGGLSVKWYTDNQAVTCVIFKASMVDNLQHSSLKMFKMCLENNITLSIDWIPCDLNDEADQLSKH